LELVESMDICFTKVPGHSGDKWNERADALARQGMVKSCKSGPAPETDP